jgi:hypothetical protein
MSGTQVRYSTHEFSDRDNLSRDKKASLLCNREKTLFHMYSDLIHHFVICCQPRELWQLTWYVRPKYINAKGLHLPTVQRRSRLYWIYCHVNTQFPHAYLGTTSWRHLRSGGMVSFRPQLLYRVKILHTPVSFFLQVVVWAQSGSER